MFWVYMLLFRKQTFSFPINTWYYVWHGSVWCIIRPEQDFTVINILCKVGCNYSRNQDHFVHKMKYDIFILRGYDSSVY